MFRAGNWYLLKFDARATRERNMTIRMGLATTEGAGWIENFKGASNYPLYLTTDMQTFYVIFYVHAEKSEAMNSNGVVVEFKLGTFNWNQTQESMNPVYFDNVQFYLLSNIDNAPEISEVENMPVKFGKNETMPDFTKYITAFDVEDAKDIVITSEMIDTTDVQMDKVGQYQVRFNVPDSKNNIAKYSITINVIETKDETEPVITEVEGLVKEIDQFSDPINLLNVVKITDNEDGNIEVTKTMIEGYVDVTKAGEYEVKYTVFDLSGNKAELTLSFVIKDKEAPKFTGNNTLKVRVGDTLDLLSLVSVTDNVDGKITLSLDNFTGYEEFMSEGKVTTIGQYVVNVEVTDNSGNVGSLDINVIVEEKATEVLVEDEVLYDMIAAQQPIDAGSASYATVTYDNGIATIKVSDVGGWASFAKMKIQLSDLVFENTYKIKLNVKADQARKLGFCVGQSLNSDPWYDKFTIIEDKSEIVISDEYKTYEILFIYDKELKENGPYLEFRFGNLYHSGDVADNDIYIQSFQVISMKTEIVEDVALDILGNKPSIDSGSVNAASVSYDEEGIATISITDVGSWASYAKMKIPLTELEFGKKYILKFVIKADSPRNIKMNLGQSLYQDPWMEKFTTLESTTVSITDDYAEYLINFVYDVENKDGGPTLEFCFGNTGNSGDVNGNSLYISQMKIINNGLADEEVVPTITLSDNAKKQLESLKIIEGTDLTETFTYLQSQITINNGDQVVSLLPEMIDLDGLNVANPAAGEYVIVISYTNEEDKTGTLEIPILVDVEDEVLFEDFESYDDTAALQASGWHKRYNGNNTTSDLELIVDGENKAAKFTFTNDSSTPHHFRKDIVGSNYSSQYAYIKFQVLTAATKIELWAYTSTNWNGKSYNIADITSSDGYCYIKISDTGYKLQDLVYIGLSFKGQTGDFAYFDNISFVKSTPAVELKSVLLDDFESYADSAALQASGWHKRYNGNNTTSDLELVVDGENKAAKFTFTNDASTPHHFRKDIVGSDYDSSLKYIRFKVQTTATKIELWAYTSTNWNGKSYNIADITSSDGYCYIKISDTGYNLQDLVYIGLSFKGQTGDYAIFDNIEFVNINQN